MHANVTHNAPHSRRFSADEMRALDYAIMYFDYVDDRVWTECAHTIAPMYDWLNNTWCDAAEQYLDAHTQ